MLLTLALPLGKRNHPLYEVVPALDLLAHAYAFDCSLDCLANRTFFFRQFLNLVKSPGGRKLLEAAGGLGWRNAMAVFIATFWCPLQKP